MIAHDLASSYNLLFLDAFTSFKLKPDFLNLQGNRKLLRVIGGLDKSRVKLQTSTVQRKRKLVREKPRVREIGVLLCHKGAL